MYRVDYEWLNFAVELQKQGKRTSEIAKAVHETYGFGASYKDIVNIIKGQLLRKSTYNKPEVEYQEPTYRETVEYKSDGTVVYGNCIKLTERGNVTPEQIMEAHGLDINCWKVSGFISNYWNAQDKDGQIVMCQYKLSVKAIEQSVSFDVYRDLFKELNRTAPIQPITYKKQPGRKSMAEVNIADLHFAKLCWHGNTGENYDHKIAKANFESIVERICSELKGNNLDYILFVWSNDYFNSDNDENTTTGKTIQDTDLRFEKMVKMGVQMLCWAIEQFKLIAPVTTFRTPSNHDKVLSLAAILVLEAYFRNDPNVTVSDSSMPRYYVQYGNSLTGHGHGDKEGKESLNKEKASKLASTMPNEAGEMWGKTLYHEMHVAHLHSEQMLLECNGVIVRRISTPTAADTWHTESGYIGNTRKAQTFIYDYEDDETTY